MHGDGVQGWERAGFLNKNHSLEDEKEEKDEKEETKMGGDFGLGEGGTVICKCEEHRNGCVPPQFI